MSSQNLTRHDQNMLDRFGLLNQGFASDNNSAVLPEVFEFIQKINRGHVAAYGGDKVTEYAEEIFKNIFGKTSNVHFVFGGTAANVLSIKACLHSYESVICADTSHMNVDECGAPEFITGVKLVTIKGRQGKISPEDISPLLIRRGDQHFSQPRMVSITQPTELGTVYTVAEIQKMSEFCKKNKLLLHVDGSRLVNAASSLGESVKNIVEGVDILSFGGTKNGLMLAEAVVVLNPELNKNFRFIRKQSMQLASKMRFVSGQFIPFFENDLWKKYAGHSLQMAQELRSKVLPIEGVKLLYEVQSNALFLRLPKNVIAKLREHYFFYVWDENTWDVRWMTTFDTKVDDVEKLSLLLKKEMAAL